MVHEIAKLRENTVNLSNKLLRVIDQIEVGRGAEMPLTADEVDFRRQLESLQRKLSNPAQFEARVTELKSRVRMQGRPGDHSGISLHDGNTLSKLLEFLDTQRKGLESLTVLCSRNLVLSVPRVFSFSLGVNHMLALSATSPPLPLRRARSSGM